MPVDILHDYIISSHFLTDEVVVLGGVIFFKGINTKWNVSESRYHCSGEPQSRTFFCYSTEKTRLSNCEMAGNQVQSIIYIHGIRPPKTVLVQDDHDSIRFLRAR